MPGHKYDIQMPSLCLKAGEIHHLIGKRRSGKSALGVILAKESLASNLSSNIVHYARHIMPAFCYLPRVSHYRIHSLNSLKSSIVEKLSEGENSLIVIDDVDLLTNGSSRKLANRARQQAALISLIKQKQHNIPVIMTSTQNPDELRTPYPGGVSSAFLSENYHIHCDHEDSWELVDEKGGHLGHRVTIKDGKSFESTFWIDGKNQVYYDRARVERKQFED